MNRKYLIRSILFYLLAFAVMLPGAYRVLMFVLVSNDFVPGDYRRYTDLSFGMNDNFFLVTWGALVFGLIFAAYYYGDTYSRRTRTVLVAA